MTGFERRRLEESYNRPPTMQDNRPKFDFPKVMKQAFSEVLTECQKHWLPLAFAVLIFAGMNLFLLAHTYHGRSMDAQTAGEFGDFIGGYFGPLFSLLGIFLLIVTIREQRQATSDQIASAEKQAFQERFFELLTIHRDNANEVKILETTGRKVFVHLIDEWREILRFVSSVAKVNDFSFSQRELLQVSYYCLFFGMGEQSSRMLQAYLPQISPSLLSELEHYVDHKSTLYEMQRHAGLPYVPLQGHQSRLGHYYRHLYQMVRYVNEQGSHIDKYEFVKIIRAQLSTHEQALLLLNSLTPIGNDWWEKKLIVTYRMVQNLPLTFFTTGEIDLLELFGLHYFEGQLLQAHEMASLDKPATLENVIARRYTE